MTKHEILPSDVCWRNDARRDQYLHSVAEAIHDQNDGYTAASIKEMLRGGAGGIQPDAYKIVPEKRTVIFWEIEHTHPLSHAKIAQLAALFYEIGDFGWEPELRIVDRYGNENVCHILGGCAAPARVVCDREYRMIFQEWDELDFEEKSS